MNFNDYQKEAAKTGVYKESYYPFASLMIEAAEFADVVTKTALRGDPKEVNKDELLSEAGDVLWNLSECLSQFSLSLQDAAEYNVSKLRSRKERGKLMGDGGSR